MKCWPILVLLCSNLPSMAADNPLNFSKHPLGKTPIGFRASTGEVNEWKVIEAELPSALNSGLIVKRRCLHHRGGKNGSNGSSTLILKSPDYTDFVLKTSFRIDDGNNAKAAGIIFRAQKDNSYVRFAIIPEKNHMIFSLLWKGTPVGNGKISKIKLPKDGWYHLELTCQNDQISGRLNGGAFDPIPLIDMPPGKLGFWTKGNTNCQFAMSSVALPLSFAQSVLNEVVQNNKHLQRMELAATRAGEKHPEVVAASDLKQVGQSAHASCRGTIENGAEVYSKGREAIEVIVPVKNVDGDIMAAARMFMKPGRLTTRARHQARASAVAILLGKRIQTHAKLFR